MKEKLEVDQKKPEHQLLVWHWADWAETIEHILATSLFIAILSYIVWSMVYNSHHSAAPVSWSRVGLWSMVYNSHHTAPPMSCSRVGLWSVVYSSHHTAPPMSCSTIGLNFLNEYLMIFVG
jgi:hypothetical protein